MEDLAGDPGGVFGGEEDDQARGVFGQADTAYGRGCGELGVQLRRHPAGVGGAEIDGIDGDAAWLARR